MNPAAAVAAAVLALADPKPADEVRNLVILGDTRPIVARVTVRVGDRSPDAAWLEAVAAYHRALDRNGDGKVAADEAEAAGVGSPPAPATPTIIIQNNAPRPRPEVDRNPKDGVVSVEELAEALRSTVAPFQVRAGVAGDRRTDALFDQLDRDKDGRLARSELAAIGGSLRRLDRDDDERIAADEVAASVAESAGGTMPAAPTMMMGGRPARDPAAPPVLERSAGESPLRVLRILTRRYDVGGPRGPGRPDGKLSPDEFALPPEAFARFDANRDGLLASDELRKWLESSPPDLVVEARMTADAAGPAVIRATVEPGLTARQVNPGVVEVEAGAIRLDLHADDGTGRIEQARKRARSLFDAADANADGYLEANELDPQETPGTPLAGMLRLLDCDGDGKVVPGEVDAVAAADASLAQARLTLAANDEGRALFGLLDGDRDRSLGAREVLDAFGRVSACDRDRDGHVAPDEVPHHIRIDLGRGDLPAWLAPGRVVSVADPMNLVTVSVSLPGSAAPQSGPDWFRKMDRNRDGDVSRREFLGTREQFDRVDRDRDGLVSPAEAAAITPEPAPAAVKGPGG